MTFDGAMVGIDLLLGDDFSSAQLDEAGRPFDSPAQQVLEEDSCLGPHGTVPARTVHELFDYWKSSDDVEVVANETTDGRLRIELRVGDGFDGWSAARECLVRLGAIAAQAGASGRLAVAPLREAASEGAGFVGISVGDGAMTTVVVEELQDLDPDTIRAHVPDGLRYFTKP